MEDFEKKRIIEGALYLVGEYGLNVGQVAKMLETDEEDALDLLYDLQSDFHRDKRGLQIIEIADVFQLVTYIEHAPFYERLVAEDYQVALSQAAMETLSIIAYNQPITKLEIEEIRGVKSDRSLNNLLVRNLVEEAGRKDAIGKPKLYRTTKDFLDCFGLSDIKDLPQLPDLTFSEESAIRSLFD